MPPRKRQKSDNQKSPKNPNQKAQISARQKAPKVGYNKTPEMPTKKRQLDFQILFEEFSIDCFGLFFIKYFKKQE